VASVVPAHTRHIQSYPALRLLTLGDIPLGQTYPTLGHDRALALWGAGCEYGWPVVVIDGGTALTLTGADGQGNLVGGAILPGLGLQWQSLGQNTAQLPRIPPGDWADRALILPPRWARNPQEAIASGILYTLLAGLREFIAQWQEQYPHSPVVCTGGDSPLLAQGWMQRYPTATPWIVDADLGFKGMLWVTGHQP